MKKIYFVLTYTGTFLSRVVRYYTKEQYSHISIAFDEKLKEMYSFGRFHAYNPFIGGFVQESPDKGIYKRFPKTITKIYSLEVSDAQYQRMKEIILYFHDNKARFHFNTLGLFSVPFRMKWNRENHFYCAEFVKYVLENSNLNISLPEFVKPNDFQNISGMHEVYTGILKEYNLNCSE